MQYFVTVHRLPASGQLVRRIVFGLATLLVCIIYGVPAGAQQTLPAVWVNLPMMPGIVTYSPDGKYIALTGRGPKLEILDAASKTGGRAFPTVAIRIVAIAFSSDGKMLADVGITSASCIAEVWDVSTGKLISTFNSGATYLNCVAFSSDGKTLADGGWTNSTVTGTLELWSVASGKQIASLSTGSATTVWGIAFSRDGKTLADGGTHLSSSFLELRDATTGQLLSSLPTTAAGLISLALSPDGKTLVDCGFNKSGGVLELWNVSSRKLASSLPTSAFMLFSVNFSSDGKMLADGGQNYDGGVLEIWNVSTEKLVTSLPTAANLGPWSVAFSPDGSTLVDSNDVDVNSAPMSPPVVEFWNVPAGTLSAAFFGSQISGVAFSPDGGTLACGGSNGAGSILQLLNASRSLMKKSEALSTDG
jgi:WD40 repeat protein